MNRRSKLAWGATAVDFAPGSQGVSPEATVKHAMGARRQTVEEAIAATNAYIQTSIINGNLAGAIHAGQDLATPAHAGYEWTGYKWNWETASHIVGDMFPSWKTIKQAFQNTKSILSQNSCSK